MIVSSCIKNNSLFRSITNILGKQSCIGYEDFHEHVFQFAINCNKLESLCVVILYVWLNGGSLVKKIRKKNKVGPAPFLQRNS